MRCSQYAWARRSGWILKGSATTSPRPCWRAGFSRPKRRRAFARDDDAPSRRITCHRLLSRKEACAKASGGRFLDSLRLKVPVPGTVLGTGPLAGQRWTLRDLPVPPGLVGALATAGEETGEIRLFEWDWRFGLARQVAAVLPEHPPRAARQVNSVTEPGQAAQAAAITATRSNASET